MGNEVKICIPPKPTANSELEEIEKLKTGLILFREETQRRDDELRKNEQLIAEKQQAMRKELDSLEKERKKWLSEKDKIESETKRLIKEKDRILNELIEKQRAAKEADAKKSVVDADAKKVLKVVDSLLGKLPDKVVNRFAKSKDFELYKKVLKKYGVG